jgi:hypothetical protein
VWWKTVKYAQIFVWDRHLWVERCQPGNHNVNNNNNNVGGGDSSSINSGQLLNVLAEQYNCQL